MATTVYTDNQHYADIAEAIRNKNGSSTHYRPGEMADAIDALIVSGSAPRLQSKTVTPSTAQQIISYDGGYNGLDQVTVNAISPINNVNSLTVNDATVSVPMGYYTTNVSKTVASGTQGTPIATKGTVNNNSVMITPSVQNTKGFISGGTLTGENVSVSASELVSGTLNIITNGTQDVTNYASVSVNVPASDFINNQNKTVTPTTSTQIITFDSNNNFTGLGTVTVNPIPSSYIIPSGSLTITDNGTTTDVTNLSEVKVQIPEMTLPTGASVNKDGTTKGTVLRSGAVQYLNIPVGYNSTKVSYTINPVEDGAIRYVTASKSTVSNNSITVTPSATISTGYIIGGTYPGGEVVVSASELVSGTLNIVDNGDNIDVTNYQKVNVNIPVGDTINNQNKTVSPSLSQQIITFDNGYTGLGSVTVEAMTAMTLPTAASSTRVGTEKATINRSTATQYINIPIGYNSATASYKINAIADGSVANPVATKGTVNNNSISVTPSVASTTGYITGGTKTGTAVTVSASELVSGNKAISANGSNIDVTNYATVSVNIPSETFATQEKEVSPTESVIMVQPDSGFNGLSQVTVGAISSSYVGSGITRRNSTSLTASGATVTVPAGYYETAASKSVATMTLPGETSQTSSGTSKLTITPSRFMQYLNIPVGYNSTASYYTIEGEWDLEPENIIDGVSIFGVQGTGRPLPLLDQEGYVVLPYHLTK